jgi:hypothetical protein
MVGVEGEENRVKKEGDAAGSRGGGEARNDTQCYKITMLLLSFTIYK